jgi:hypothetical protein
MTTLCFLLFISLVSANNYRRGGVLRHICSKNKTHGRSTAEVPLWNHSLYLKNTTPSIFSDGGGNDEVGVVFFHISKCGGTLMCALAKNATVRRAPARNCQLAGGDELLTMNKRQIIYNYDTSEISYNPNTSVCYHVIRNQYRAAYVNSVKGGLEYMTFESGWQGQVRVRLAISVQPHMYFVTMLRDPLRHSVSTYNFFNRRNRPFLEWFNTQGRVYIDEIYVRTFSDAQLGANLTERHLEVAIDTLNRLNLVLLLPEDDMCTNFIDLLCKRLAWSYYCEPRQIMHVNVGEIQLRLSQNETDFMHSKIVWDRRLYSHAVSISPCISDVQKSNRTTRK